MSAKANYYKLGLFVIGAAGMLILLLIILGTGRLFQQKVLIESYFNESVQGLDIGSKVKYRGVVVGEVTHIGFTYTKYQLDKPAAERLRYVLVEATVRPRLIGSRAGGDITTPETARMEIEKGLRIRLAPQGITGTNYLEIDYVDPKANPGLPIDWEPDNLYIPSAPSTFSQFVSSAADVIGRLQQLDLEGTLVNLNKLLVTMNSRAESLDTRQLSDNANRVLAKVDKKLDQLPVDQIGKDSTALLAELRASNQKLIAILDDPAWKKLPSDADAAVMQVKKLVEDPNLARTLMHLQSTLAKLDRVFGGGERELSVTLQNLRQITDNLRDLTEEAKQYPSRVILGEPPLPAKGTK